MSQSEHSTVVVQSHRQPLPHAWLQPCLDSVRGWAESQGYGYRFVDDELFDLLSLQERQVCREQPVVASDLARLRLCQQVLAEGSSRVVWCDADSLVIDSSALELAADGCAFGRELWLQQAPSKRTKARSESRNGRPRLYKKIHNAFMQFSANDPVLDFYEFAATRLLAKHAENIESAAGKKGAEKGGAEHRQADKSNTSKPMVAQFLGPKFLTHLHNVVDFRVFEQAQVMSPLLAQALLVAEPRLLDRYRAAWERPAAVVNLCASEVLRGSLDDAQMQALIELLLAKGTSAFTAEPRSSLKDKQQENDRSIDFGRIVVGIKRED